MTTQSTSGQHAPAGAPPAQAMRRSGPAINAKPPHGEAKRARPAPRSRVQSARRRPAASRTAAGHTGTQGAERHSQHAGQPWVCVNATTGEPLGLAHPAQVRIWLAKGKARMHRLAPAVVNLHCPHAQACYLRRRPHNADVRLGVDPGDTAGVALIIDHKVVWSAEIHHRSKHIRKKLAVRRGARSARRCRRKRKADRPAKPARWRHRTRAPGWLPPSVRHRVDAPLRWVRFLLPYARAHAGTREVHAHVEVCAFDAHKVLHPDVEGEAYQRGPLWRANLRGYVLTRDRAQCVYCGTRTGPFYLDHVVPHSRGGADGPTNRVTACKACDKDKGDGALETWLNTTRRAAVRHRAARTLETVRRIGAGGANLAALAATNVVAPAIADALEDDGLDVVRNSGADTFVWRHEAGKAKTHAVDATCTALQGTPAKWCCDRALRITMTGRGRNAVVKHNASGFPRLTKDGTIVQSYRETPPHGFRAGDMVRIDKKGVGRRRRIGTLRTARHDGRCTVETHNGTRLNVMAATLTLIHRGCGARVQ